MKPQYIRIVTFVVGAIGAIWQAVELALSKDAQVTPAHLIAVAGVAVCAFAMKYPGDVTSGQAKEIEERAKRASILPPPGGES